MWGNLTPAHPLTIAVLIIILNWFVSQPLTSADVSYYASVTVPKRNHKLWHVARLIYHWAKKSLRMLLLTFPSQHLVKIDFSNLSFYFFFPNSFHSSLILLLKMSYGANSINWVISEIIDTDYSRNHGILILYLLKCIYKLGFSK